MLYLTLIVSLLLQSAGPAPQTDTATDKTKPVFTDGPLRAEFVAMREVRQYNLDPQMADRTQSDLRILIRLAGEQLTDISKYGDLIITEIRDDTGKSLLEEDTYADVDESQLRPLAFPEERLRADGLKLATPSLLPSDRAATKLKRVSGHVRAVLADKTETVTIVNPLQYYGEVIADPRLEELGLKIRVVPLDELETQPPTDRCVVLDFQAKGDHVQKIEYFDGWNRPVASRDSWLTTEETGTKVQMFYFDGSALTDELQLVLNVHPTIEDISIPVEFENLDLP